MQIDVRLTDDDIERIATRLAQLLAQPPSTEGWLDVAGAADHLGLTQDAIRGLVKRDQIPVHRTANSRLRFSVTELDDWVRAGSCAATHQDLP